jgi:hypothetical protein
MIALLLAACLQDQMDDPSFKSWAKCKPGSWVKWEMDTGAADKSVTVELLTLKSVETDKIVLSRKLSTVQDGKSTEIGEFERIMTPTIDAKQFGTIVKESDEEIDVAGRKLKCRKLEVDQDRGGMTMKNTIWMSDEVAGGVARVHAAGGDRVVTVTVTGWEKK